MEQETTRHRMLEKEITCQLAVVGGGLSGLCAAIEAAREGIDTVLVHNRPVLGGNASSEIRMHICGADNHGGRPNARETGILEELLLENKHFNPENSYALFDMVLWGKVISQPHLTVLFNTHMTEVSSEQEEIKSIRAIQMTSETAYVIYAKLFVDATGDGTLGALAGARFMYGREGKNIFGEEMAPEESDSCTMGSSLMFTAKDMGKRIDFQKPDWAYSFDENSLANRDHRQISSGYWWIELGGDTKNTIYHAEEIRDELVKSLAGVWDHIKNGADHGAENYLIDWMGFLPGKRESRRFVGDYVLTANDCIGHPAFYDTVAYGGWHIDNHIVHGLKTAEHEPTTYYNLEEVYAIPYRALYSQNIKNLFVGGRAISCSHLAFASSRVMGTCAVAGQAIGKAAALAIRKDCMPREVLNYIELLQQGLIRDDCFLPGVKNENSLTVIRPCAVKATSWQPGFEPEEIKTGEYRSNQVRSHCWKSNGISCNGEYLEIQFTEPVPASEVRVIFDSNLSREITISISEMNLANQVKGTPPELVKDYDLELFLGDERIACWEQRGNYQRLNIFSLEKETLCDRVKLICYNTNGGEDITVFGIDIY